MYSYGCTMLGLIITWSAFIVDEPKISHIVNISSGDYTQFLTATPVWQGKGEYNEANTRKTTSTSPSLK